MKSDGLAPRILPDFKSQDRTLRSLPDPYSVDQSLESDTLPERITGAQDFGMKASLQIKPVNATEGSLLHMLDTRRVITGPAQLSLLRGT